MNQNIFNPGVGLECERNFSRLDGTYLMDRELFDSFWEEIGKKGEGKRDPGTGKPMGVRIKNEGMKPFDLTPDTGYAETEVATDVYQDLTILKEELGKMFSIFLETAKKTLPEEVVLLGIGRHPFLNHTEENYLKLRSPKGHIYTFIREGNEHIPGRLYNHEEYLAVTSDQVNIDLPNGLEFKTILALKQLSPFLVALSANSPFFDGKIASHKSSRQEAQFKMMSSPRYEADRQIIGMPNQEPDSFNWYFKKWYQHRPMTTYGGHKTEPLCLPIKENGEVPTFFEFLQQDEAWQAKTIEGNLISVVSQDEDVKTALARLCFWNIKPQFNFSTAKKIKKRDFLKALEEDLIFEFLKEKGVGFYAEARLIDSALPGEEVNMAAFLKGLLINMEETLNFLQDFPYEILKELYLTASRTGMDFDYRGKRAKVFLNELLDIAERGLKKVNEGKEAPLLKQLWGNVAQEKTPADHLLEAFHQNGFEGVIKKIRLNN